MPQAIFAGGDGWIYSFRAASRPGCPSGKPELLWKFDANPKKSVWKTDGSGDRNNLVATPVVYDGRVYIATGAEPDYGEGPGCLWCIDPTKRGDVSPELVVDKQGKPISDAVRPSRRIRAIDESAGETVRPNPNSAAVWRYAGFDANGNGKLDFEETMHRSISMAVIKDGLLVIADLSGAGPLPGREDRQGPLDARPDVADLGLALRGRRQDLHRRPGRRRGGVRAFAEAEAAGQERDGRPGLQHAGRGRRRALHFHRPPT